MTPFDDASIPLKSPRLYRRTLGLLLAAGCLGRLLCGCGSTTATSGTTRIRAFNTYIPASGTDGSVTITTSSGVTLSGTGTLPFGSLANSGAYTSVTSGSLTITASGAGLTSPVTLTSVFNGNNAAYTVVMAGLVGQTNALIPQLLAIPNYTANQIVLPSGDAAVRVVNLSLNPNPVGLYSTASSVPTTAVNANLGSVAYGYSAANGYVAVPTTQLTGLAVVDTTNPLTPLTLSSASNLTSATFTSGQAYTLYIYGQPGNTTQALSATWVQDYP